MANINGSIVKQKAQPSKPVSQLGLMIKAPNVQERFEKMLGKKANSFLSSLLSLVNNNKLLSTADPNSVLAAAATAASLDLPINPSLGFAWIVPYGKNAQFQLGYKGLIQLAQRSGVMKSIVSTEVYEGEIRNFNRFTETYEVGEKLSDKVVGYYASFELINGFKKCTYVPHDEVIKHARKFSKTFNNGPWQTDQIAMCKKTVLANLLRTFAPMSNEMQEGILNDLRDQYDKNGGADGFIDSVMDGITFDGEIVTDDGQTVDVATGEIKE